MRRDDIDPGQTWCHRDLGWRCTVVEVNDNFVLLDWHDRPVLPTVLVKWFLAHCELLP